MQRSIRLSTALIGGTVVIIGAMLAAMLLTIVSVSRDVLDEQVERLITEDNEDASAQVLNLVESAERLVGVASASWDGALEAEADRSSLIALLRSDPAYQGLFVGRPDGRFTFVTDHPRGTRIKEITVGPRTVTNTIVSADGTLLDVALDPDDLYDPTTRPWYTLAAENGRTVWTSPYVFFDSQQPGVTVASPLAGGAAEGVVGLDLSFQSLSTFLQGLETSQNSVAVILDRAGQVLAYSDPESDLVVDGDRPGLASLTETGSPVIIQAATEFLASDAPDRYMTLDVDGTTYLTAFSTLDVGSGWLVGVAAPEDDYLGAVDASERDLTGLIAIIGLLAVATAAIFTRMIARPLGQMRLRAQAAVAGEHLQEREPSRFREIESADKAMYLAQEQLEARVADRTSALEAEVEQRRAAELDAERASRAKSEFLARVSHELRTPLTAIIGFTSFLEAEEGEVADSEIWQTAVSSIQTSASHQLELINEILDIARIESGNESLDEQLVDVDGLFVDVEGMLAGLADEQGVEIVRSVPNRMPDLMGDERRLRQILINLAGNAVKFTPSDGRVELRASVARDGGALLEVRDSGPGMSEEQLEQALTLFSQVKDSDYTQAGSGLGLNLAQELAELHGGWLNLISTPGEGTTAQVWLPPHRLFPVRQSGRRADRAGRAGQAEIRSESD